MKRILSLVAAVLMAAFSFGLVYGANWSDSLTLTVTPTGDRGVIIDSTTYNFGSMDTNTSSITVNAIPVKSTGTIADMDYTLQGANNATWTLEADTVLTPSGQDKAVLCALFQNTAAQPISASFGSDDTVTTSAQQVGDGGSVNFEGTGDCDSLGLNVTRYLYFKITTPPTTSVTGEQTFTVTVAAEASN